MAAPIQVPGFEISHLIARGGMARVYSARQTTLGRDVALKVMDNNGDESFADRFLNEGRLIASLRHPNVITIHDLGVLEDGRAFISMEYVGGGDLENRLEKETLSEKQILGILRSLAESLQYIHDNDVIHRDIKPANILFRKDGSLVLTDFGIAKQLDNQDIKLTRDGQAVGSPGYMSPEQAQAMDVDHRTDIYSVGVILAEMLVGRNLFEADSYIQTSMNHIQMDIPTLPIQYRKYQRLLNKMLAKDPDKRFPNAKALVDYVDQIPSLYGDITEEVEPIVEDDIPVLEMDKPEAKGMFAWLTRNESLIFMFFLAAILIGGVFGFQYMQKHKQVNDLLKNAEKAYSSDRLMLPKKNNAYYYYSEVLKLEPKNPSANEGLDKLVDRYASLAEGAYQSRKMEKMKSFVERGLSIDPDNKRLLALQKKR